MALTATIYNFDIELAHVDRNVYETLALRVARHPSETDERLMVRLLAFAMYADERLEFGRGLSSDDEPDLWLKSRSGEIELWIDLGQPDDSRIRKACGRSQQVVVINYSGRGADIWWDKIAPSLTRCGNLTVIDIAADTVAELAALADRGMRLQCMIQDGHVELYGEGSSVTVQRTLRMAPTARVA